MKSRLLVAALLLIPSLASARDVGFGLGVELPPITLADDAQVSFEQRLLSLEVPVFSGRWRFAPALGYASGSTDSGPGLGKAEVTRLSLGAGVARAFEPTETLRSWVGGRAGVGIRQVGETDSELDPFVGAVGGGEYFLGSTLSLGADLRVTYASLGAARWEAEETATSWRLVPVRGWSLVADFALSLRYYPW